MLTLRFTSQIDFELEINLSLENDIYLVALNLYNATNLLASSDSMVINKKSIDFISIFFLKRSVWTYYDRVNTNFLCFDFSSKNETFKIEGSILNTINFQKYKFEIMEISNIQLSKQLQILNDQYKSNIY